MKISNLHIGILVNKEGEIANWEYEMIRSLTRTKNLSLAFIKTTCRKKSRTGFAYKLFCLFEDLYFRKRHAFKIKNGFTEFNLIPVADLDETVKPDIFFITGNAERPGDLRAKFGNWEIVWGDKDNLDVNPPAFWEVMNHDPVTAAMLLVSTPSTKNICVYYGTTTTVPFSVKNNLNHIAYQAGSYFTYRIEELLMLGSETFFKNHTDTVLLKTSDRYPSNWQMGRLFTRNFLRYIGDKLVGKPDPFTILFSFQTYKPGVIDFKDFIALPPITGGFRADPFLFMHEGRYYVFFEEYISKKGKGHISVIELLPGGKWTHASMILDKPFHLSYPLVFEWKGEIYMIPESAHNLSVKLYKSNSFPFQWEFVKDLIENVFFLDATVLFENNKWWLFGTTISVSGTSSNNQLLLYYTDDLLSGEWIPHPQNPVVTSISHCRPAGKIFRQNGKLYRPAQNNGSFQYGFAITINEIEIINETRYKEKVVDQLLPTEENGLHAIHTFNFTENLIVIDGILRKKKVHK